MTERTVFFVSDQTGVTAETLGHSLLTQFDGVQFKAVTVPFVDSVDKAAQVSERTKDISEFMSDLGLMPPARSTGLAVAYHAACSLQHGQQVRMQPKNLLTAAGFTIRDLAEGHLCCGSAGTYNILQPAIAKRLRDRKIETI